MENPRQIPLRRFHADRGARFVDFGGWEMPVQYTSILDEHKAVREKAGLFDVSHMGEVWVRGERAAEYLDRLLVNAVGAAPSGKAVYSPMCQEDGGAVDDLIVYRVDEAAFLICVNAANARKDFDWMLRWRDAWGMDVEIADASDDFALLALQGPEAMAILEDAGIEGAGAIKKFRHRSMPFGDAGIRVCRTGYTGEDGVEIYVSPADAEALARGMVEAGESRGLRLCGLGARDSLRLEAGLPLYGHELSETISPLEAGLGWTVKFDKGDFVGKDALAAQKEKGLERRVIHFRLEGRRIAREGAPVVPEGGGEPVGEVLSGTQSPVLNRPIGSALARSEALDGGGLAVDLRGKAVPLEIAKPPLHK